jgi:hypothetical protein
MITSLLLSLFLAITQSADLHLAAVGVFLAPIPSAEGFLTAALGFEDSYRDLREEFRKNGSFQQVIRLVANPGEASVLVEVANRGLTDSGVRTGTATATSGATVVGTSVPILRKQLFARLAVSGSDYRLEIDGAAGLRRTTFRNQAKNVLQQVVDWVKANRSRLEAK